MRLPALFNRERSPQAVREAQDHAEKMLVDALRVMGNLFGKVADLVEAQRLARGGYEKQERFLERLDGEEPKK